MKWKVLGFLLCAAPVLFLACGDNAFNFLADEDSDEACRYEVSKSLDGEDYDAVLESLCADDIQRGAAYFGKAGYDINHVLKILIDSGSSESDDLSTFMSQSFTGKVTNNTLSYLGDSDVSYAKVKTGPYTEDEKKDAEFNRSVVNIIKSLSLLKIILDVDGDGVLSGCNINDNGIADEADAVACVLGICNASSASLPTGDMTLYSDPARTQPLQGTYRGVTVTINGTPTSSCTNKYRELKYKAQDGKFYVATTTAETCYDGGTTWPCPAIIDGRPLGLAEALQQGLTTSLSALAAAIGASDADVARAIEEINNGACGSDGICSDAEIAQYLQTL